MLERGWSEILESIDFCSYDMVPVLPAGLRVTTELKPPASKSPEDSTLVEKWALGSQRPLGEQGGKCLLLGNPWGLSII